MTGILDFEDFYFDTELRQLDVYVDMESRRMY